MPVNVPSSFPKHEIFVLDTEACRGDTVYSLDILREQAVAFGSTATTCTVEKDAEGTSIGLNSTFSPKVLVV